MEAENDLELSDEIFNLIRENRYLYFVNGFGVSVQLTISQPDRHYYKNDYCTGASYNKKFCVCRKVC